MMQLEAILHLLDGGFSKLHVLVVGDVMLDRYIWGKVDRISPEAPVPVLRSAQRTAVAGGAANVAANLAGLGLTVSLAGAWGNDDDARELASLLSVAQINTHAMVTCAHPTISKTRIVALRQQMLRLDVESLEAHTAETCDALASSALREVGRADAVILSDYAKGVLTAELCESLISAARKRGIPVLADPKERDFAKYRGATTVCPNLSELAAALGVSPHQAATDSFLIDRGRELVRTLGLDFLTVTMSEKGIRLIGPVESFHSPARAREVFDVSGAGDTVIATLAGCLAAGIGAQTAVQLANVAAGVVVGKAGTHPITRSELVAELTQSSSLQAQDKIFEANRIAARVKEWRDAGQTIVFTNGCFDLLHVGHITLLEQCRRFGDKLIVGVNRDSSVRGLGKGTERPIVGEDERAQVLAALASTDAVVLFSEATPLELIRTIRPNVLVKGGDYTEATVVGAEDVRSWGGRIEIVPLVGGFSTTAILEKLQPK